MNLRVPKDLRDLIREAAKRNNRTQTAEAVSRLEESFAREGIVREGAEVGPRISTDSDTRELIVAMEMLLNQVDLMRKELNGRLKGLKGGEDEQS
ncbi:Arc family DNA-binding protein [Halomonas sp. McH1-25]|uniref:Arc family DNA-binding protein n=1 Tax=unclassified Halomonas TaxID=2609666 RepID=UPI001EF495C7|nr:MULTISPECIES: Arc family DNA-binding protein [unclassified Halomonas]MCG7598421.1 Arc family DNA-binding protein [Halomonas sp. McH1-25]MCP1343757.1 Arc family DNA-binding protein [Halomonas sp. FL8]MCP1361736.1 Arc family DNA-binding protein [Halomonas sp. BBD45]MCP1363996.1 Arc family DNA-binding protein [Halomonas sp. BBD48]